MLPSIGTVVLRTVLIISLVYYPCSVDAVCKLPNATNTFVDRIFDKYGSVRANRTESLLNTTGLNRLLKDLSLSNFTVVCKEDDEECKRDETLLKKRHESSRKRRSVEVDKIKVEAHDSDLNKQRKECAELNLTVINKFIPRATEEMTKQEFINACPFLLDKVVSKTCVHYHGTFPKFVPPARPPTAGEKWGYGMVAITICSLLSLVVIAMIPCLQKSFYDKMMAYLVALAVGTLCGDALLHLIPHAFIEGANNAAFLKVDEEQKEAQHLSQVYRALVVMGGIYLFFVVEQLMRLKGAWSKRNQGGHGHEEKKMLDKVGDEENKLEKQEEEVLVEDGGHSHAPSGHAHSHGDKDITGETNISSVAWMVVVGDGFHNFSDGLAVGAAFSASISSGVSTTIAIFCHELPHELGDFAILLAAGMSAKQAIVYNLVGAILSYCGLAIGILIGTGELGRHIILCLTAGLFLYISLVNMMSEVVGNEADILKCGTVLCQHLGMLSGIAIMLVISIYEHDI